MEDEGFIVNMMFYKKSMHKFILFVILSIISGGFIFILSHWILDLQIILTLSLTTNVEECDCILIKSAGVFRISIYTSDFYYISNKEKNYFLIHYILFFVRWQSGDSSTI